MNISNINSTQSTEEALEMAKQETQELFDETLSILEGSVLGSLSGAEDFVGIVGPLMNFHESAADLFTDLTKKTLPKPAGNFLEQYFSLPYRKKDFQDQLQRLAIRKIKLDDLGLPKPNETLAALEARAKIDIDLNGIIGSTPDKVLKNIIDAGFEIEPPSLDLGGIIDINSVNDFVPDLPQLLEKAFSKKIALNGGQVIRVNLVRIGGMNIGDYDFSVIPGMESLQGLAIPILGGRANIVPTLWGPINSEPDNNGLPQAFIVRLELQDLFNKGPKTAKKGKWETAAHGGSGLYLFFKGVNQGTVGGFADVRLGGHTLPDWLPDSIVKFFRSTIELRAVGYANGSELFHALDPSPLDLDSLQTSMAEITFGELQKHDEYGLLDNHGITDGTIYRNLIATIAHREGVSVDLVNAQLTMFLAEQIESVNQSFANGYTGLINDILNTPIPVVSPDFNKKQLSIVRQELATIRQELSGIDNLIASLTIKKLPGSEIPSGDMINARDINELLGMLSVERDKRLDRINYLTDYIDNIKPDISYEAPLPEKPAASNDLIDFNTIEPAFRTTRQFSTPSGGLSYDNE